ncbi:hypothetical protein DGG96_08450 [Legionella qingyii]|uniref:Uncharacterized protein n=1 Tax=Legionella qingyii TaxID=2184757 RepID=A0A317U282_9GAMM|nr:hypothetical protein DGG96_08450 [Legionella qingyii]
MRRNLLWLGSNSRFILLDIGAKTLLLCLFSSKQLKYYLNIVLVILLNIAQQRKIYPTRLLPIPYGNSGWINREIVFGSKIALHLLTQFFLLLCWIRFLLCEFILEPLNVFAIVVQTALRK